MRLDPDDTREAILEFKGMADAESQGYPAMYYALLEQYHAQVDASWMPGGYSVATRDPSIPIVVDMGSIPMLEAGSGALFRLVSNLGKKHDWMED